MYVLVCLLFITGGLKPETKMLLSAASKKKSKAGKGDANKEDESSKNDSAQPVTITLLFKRYVFDTQKKMIQSWESKEASEPTRKTRLWNELRWGMRSVPRCIRPVPSLQSLEAPADSVSTSEIPAIWFYSVKICLSCLGDVNLYGLLKNGTCQMAALGCAF